MKMRPCVRGGGLLCLMWLSGCTPAPHSITPTIIYSGCPAVSSCRIPGSRPTSNGDLSDDNRQLEAALVRCALQVETVKHCQEELRAKAEQSETGAL
ncbi:Rz1-like lysis system protein LysC [Edwardsiella tarda]|uniref:Rz1-like lysis system protein LysC n=1 Tax=Edwardsiella tarda TaxID=636 RepID=UPI001C37D8B5|nr:Rz1-like lysis system protein LysC [Edwardsiella tarda]